MWNLFSTLAFDSVSTVSGRIDPDALQSTRIAVSYQDTSAVLRHTHLNELVVSFWGKVIEKTAALDNTYQLQ